MIYNFLAILLILSNPLMNGLTNSKDYPKRKYQQAYNLIINTDEYSQYLQTNELDEICLSKNVLPHFVLSKFFLEKIDMDMMVFAKTFGGKDFHSEIEHYNSFKKINQCSNGHYIMYFTKFYKNMVFAEVLFQNERSSNYGESTVIGESLCFCVEFNNCKIEDYSVKTISNN